MRAAVLLVGAILFTGCAGPRSDPEASPTGLPDVKMMPLDRLDWSGKGCGEYALFVPTSEANVRPYVDSRFTIVAPQGRATMALAFARCTEAQIGNDPTNNLIFSDIGVSIEDPDGGPAPVNYHLWQATNRQGHHDNMTRVGLRTEFAPASNYLTFSLTQATLVESRIAWSESPYYAAGTGGPQSIPTSPEPALIWWHGSENGTMRTDYDATFQSIGP
ncbi:MAG TPA: hypothetical protein VGB18_01755, partial [Candidatus Thermoplasmatota archaeon]